MAATIAWENYSFPTARPLPDVEAGTIFECCNFTQLLPHTPIFAGVAGLTFRNCQMMNCDPPADASVDGCNTCQGEFCSNLHPEWIDAGLRACAPDCEHVVDSDEIVVDGVVVDTVYQYEDKAVE